MTLLTSGWIASAGHIRNLTTALGIVSVMTACAPQAGDSVANTSVQVPKVMLPPIRTAYDALSARDRVAYLIAVQRALENPASGQVETWKGRDGGTGKVAVVTSHEMDSGRFCRVLTETIETANGTLALNDVACWSGRSWIWLRQSSNPPVLAPLATHEVKRKRSFQNLARRVKAKQADLNVLNPLLGDQVEPGTIIYLPRAG